MLKVTSANIDKEINSRITFSDVNILVKEVLAEGSCLRVRGLGWSMYHLIRNGDSIVIEPKSIRELNIGDIILFQLPGRGYIAHRLIKKNGPTGLITKGDNLLCFDQPVSIDNVVGRVIRIERNGKRIILTSVIGRIFSFLIAWFGGHRLSHTILTRNIGRLWWLIEGRRIA